MSAREGRLRGTPLSPVASRREAVAGGESPAFRLAGLAAAVNCRLPDLRSHLRSQCQVKLGIHLGDTGRAVPENHAGGVQAEFSTNLRCLGMTQLVGVPPAGLTPRRQLGPVRLDPSRDFLTHWLRG